MKLIVAIVADVEADAVRSALVSRRFAATRIATSGGFLRRGNTTFLIGVEDTDVDQALETIGGACMQPNGESSGDDVKAFVISVARFVQL